MQTCAGHYAAVLCVALTLDGRRFVTGSADTTLRIRDLEAGR